MVKSSKKIILFLSIVALFYSCSKKESFKIDLSSEIVNPKTYVVYKADSTINIDGIADEKIWKETPFTEDFIDIEGRKIPNQNTKVKMLWDKDFLYVYAKLEEKDIWADITKRDAVIFYNNDFEVFINPSNDNHNYGEIEINALGTIWDLVLNKPYNVGGKPKNHWNLNNLKSAIFIKGTLNNSKNIDEFWSVEMAIPLSAFAELKNKPKVNPKDGEQWRINFSRVQWNHDIIDGVYSRKKENGKFLPEYNWVWSNQGAINMHLPENWGYIQFSENNPKNKIDFQHKTDVISEQITYALFRKIAFHDLKHLKDTIVGTQIKFEPITILDKTINATYLKTFTGFNLKTENKNTIYTISENGLIHRKKITLSKK